MYGVYSKFDLEMHKKTYVNYLEVIVFPDGHVEYAVPSHQEFLINVCCKKYNISRDQLNKLCPKEYYCDFTQWLCNESGCVSLWNNYLIRPEYITDEQRNTLKLLKKEKLYVGDLVC